MQNPAKNPVQATETSLDVVRALADHGRVTVSELARILDISKGTTHNHLSTLRERGFVVKEDRTYRLGLRFFELGETVRRRRTIFDIAKQEIDGLADETGELANLMVEEQGYGIYIYISRGDSAVSLDTDIGSQQYLHNSALGKAILAHLPPERVQKIIDYHGLPPETANSVTTESELVDELEQVRDDGYAFDDEERSEGIRCIAAPILTTEQEVLGAVSVSGPISRIDGDRIDELTTAVKDKATVIGINATYA